MEAESFSHPEIIKFLTQHFIPVRVDVDKEKKIASAYYVRGIPTSWFLDPDGSKITNLPGYVDREMFLVILKYIASESYQKMTLKEFLKQSRK